MSFSDFEHGINSTNIRIRQKQQQANERAAILLDRWKESERVLDFLRAIPPMRRKPTKETMDIWQARIMM